MDPEGKKPDENPEDFSYSGEKKRKETDSPEEIADALIKGYFQTTLYWTQMGIKKIGIDTSPDLQKKIILELIKKKYGFWLARNTEDLKVLDREIAIKFIEAGFEECVLQNYAKFQGIELKEIVSIILERGDKKGYITDNLRYLKGLSLKVALSLINTADNNQLYRIAYHLGAFEELNLEVARKLIESGNAEYVCQWIDRFPSNDHKKIAMMLIERGKGEEGWLGEFIGLFTNMDTEIAQKLVEKDQEDIVTNNLKCFKGLDHKEFALDLRRRGKYLNKYLSSLLESNPE